MKTLNNYYFEWTEKHWDFIAAKNREEAKKIWDKQLPTGENCREIKDVKSKKFGKLGIDN